MHRPSNGPAMSQKIFALKLEVQTVSLYLLCCALTDAGAAITKSSLMEKWNGDRAGLERELQRLEERNILVESITDKSDEAQYHLMDEKKWR